jgi:hypothetical protein
MRKGDSTRTGDNHLQGVDQPPISRIFRTGRLLAPSSGPRRIWPGTSGPAPEPAIRAAHRYARIMGPDVVDQIPAFLFRQHAGEPGIARPTSGASILAIARHSHLVHTSHHSATHQ